MKRNFRGAVAWVLGLVLVGSVQAVYAQAQLVGQDTTRRVITTAVPFLTISPDARAGAMGEAGGAISADANSSQWNPAKLALIDSEYGFALSYTPWLGKIIKDMSISYLSGYYKINREQTVAISMRYFDLGDIFFTDNNGIDNGQFNPREVAVDATYSRLLSEEFSIGVSARFIHSNLTGNFSSSTVEARPGMSAAVDLGLFYDKELLMSGSNSHIAAGLAITNIGRKLTYSNDSNRDFIPGNIRLATAFTTDLDIYNKVTVAVDFAKLLVPTPPVYQTDSAGRIVYDQNDNPVISRGKDPNRSLLAGTFGSFADAPDGFSEEIKEVMWSLGLEYWYNNLFAARTGYFHEAQEKGNRKYFTFGVGFRYNVFGLDFAYLVPTQQNNPLAETLRFTLLFNFENLNQEIESVTDN